MIGAHVSTETKTNITTNDEFSSTLLDRASSFALQITYSGLTLPINAVVKVLGSLDNTAWVVVDFDYILQNSTTKIFVYKEPAYRYMKLAVEISTGQIGSATVTKYQRGQ